MISWSMLLVEILSIKFLEREVSLFGTVVSGVRDIYILKKCQENFLFNDLRHDGVSQY